MQISLAARAAAYALAAAILVLSVVPAHLRPETAVPHRLEHATIFAITGFAFGIGYRRNRSLLGVLLVIFCGLVELLQLFMPGRHARLSDFIVDALSICLGLFIGSVIPVRT
jgi:VanZ family protein